MPEEVDERSSLLPGHPILGTRSPASPTPVPSNDIPQVEHVSQEDRENSQSTLTILTVIPVVLLGIFVAHADSSLVIATSQQVASEFNALESASWLVTSYSLAQCASQPLYGKLSTIFGRKSNLVVCYLLFALGCLLCAIGKRYWQLIMGRVISGFGGAGMISLVSVIIADIVPVRNIASWRSYVNLAATMGRSLGGPIGGWLTDTVGWRWSFLGQVPLTLAGLLLVMWKLPGPRSFSGEVEEQSILEKVKRVDVNGAISLSLAITSFLLVLDLSTKSAPIYLTIGIAILTVLLLVIFYIIERRWAKEPIVPLELITRRVAWTSYLLVGVQQTAQTSLFYATPIYFQVSTNASVGNAGLHLVPAVIGNALGGIISGLTVARTGRYKYLTIGASIVATASYILILIRWTGSTSWPESLYLFFGGFGMAVLQSTTFVHLAANLNHDDMAIAGTMLYLSQNVFGLIGIQLTTALLNAILPKQLKRSLRDIPERERIIARILSSISYIRTLPVNIHLQVVQAYIYSLRFTFATCAIFAFIGILLGLSVREKRML